MMVTDEEKLECAKATIYHTLLEYAKKEGKTYDEVLAQFKTSLVYEAWLDLETVLWKEGPNHLLALWKLYPSEE